MHPIRVYVNRDLSNPIGPNIFVSRLMKCLEDQRKVVKVRSKPDINFCVINLSNRKKTGKSLLRIDGMYWNGHDKNGLKMNPHIFRSIRQADMVVFQSDFCKRCCEHHAGSAHVSKVIHNAIDQTVVDSISADNLGAGLQFVACAKWRPTKRPNSICKGFLSSGVDGVLNMIGTIPPNPITNKKIRWMGQLPTDKTIRVMKGCDCAIHLAKFDPCPNVVIEQLSCGLPVLHADNGGTPELVKGDGVCFKVDTNWDYSILHDEIDNLDSDLVGQHIDTLAARPKLGPRDDLDIRHAARMYWQAFKELLNG